MLTAAVAPLLFAGTLASGPDLQNPPLYEIVDRMMQVEIAQEKNAPYYRSTRSYRLQNADGSKAVEMVVQVDYNGDSGKTIRVVDQRGAEGMFRRALAKVIEAEVRTSDKDQRDRTRLSPKNYTFQLAGTEVREGRRCFVLQLHPKRLSKFLIDGRAWIDAQDFGLNALEGRTAASVSFWVGKPFISQSYAKVRGIRLLARNRSVADAKLVGRMSLTIETNNVEVGGEKIALVRPHYRVTLD